VRANNDGEAALMTEPTVLIVGGPNGAGKTTLAEPYANQTGQPYLGADRIAKDLNPEDPYAVRMAAGRRFLRRLDAFIEDRALFVVESTLAGRGLARYVDRMNDAGYVTRIAFVVLDSADLCVRRVQERVRKGGHHVPEADVRRRYARSKTNFWTLYRPKVDRWHLLSNAEDGFTDVAAGTSTDTFVMDDDAFETFHRDIPTRRG
jgi:predicted ABC-type ATPase